MEVIGKIKFMASVLQPFVNKTDLLFYCFIFLLLPFQDALNIAQGGAC